MTDFQISDYGLQERCDDIAGDIIAEIKEANPGTDLSDLRDEMLDSVHEQVEWLDWVIYHHKAMTICAHCNVDDGEEYLEQTGLPELVTIGNLASIIVSGEMSRRVIAAIDKQLEAMETESD